MFRTPIAVVLAVSSLAVAASAQTPGGKPASQPASRPAAPKLLAVGDVAPDFRVSDHTGKERTLSELKGKRVVLWFYPKASTGGCTKEGCGFRDKYADYEKLGVVVLGVSVDTVEDNAKFVKEQKFPFPLLCDTKRDVCVKYGACADAKSGWADRITYVVGADGKIEHVIAKVNPMDHAATLIEVLSKKPTK